MWIKVDHTTPDKPEVFQVAERLEIDPDAVVGKLVRLWVWADQQTYDGHAPGVTKSALDRVTSVTGFADALIAVGWIEETDGEASETEIGLVFPNFDRHNGQTAKRRALATKRKQSQRTKCHASVTQVSRSERDASVTRVEKSRYIKEEEENACARGDELTERIEEFLSVWNANQFTANCPGAWCFSRLDFIHETFGSPSWWSNWRQALERLPLRAHANRTDPVDVMWFTAPERVAEILSGKYDRAPPASRDGASRAQQHAQAAKKRRATRDV